MKLLRLLSLCALCSSAGLPIVSVRAAAPSLNAATDAYTTAVNQYVAAARAEIAAVRSEQMANEKQGKQEQFAAVKSRVDDCEALIDRLKNAGPSTFDALKSQYEAKRADLLQKLNTARQAAAAAQPAQPAQSGT